MMRETERPSLAKRQLLIVFAIWVVVGCLMAWDARMLVAQRLFPDPDDAMRLVQVRDWLAGQNWFDVTQYRLNPPSGGPMHWSRLVDLPIAAVILVCRPILGQFGAESAALIMVPLLTLLIAMLLVQRIGSKLLDDKATLLAVLATPVSLGAMKQMRIMRIDHHGWQIVLALAALLALIDKKRPIRSAAIAGAAIALWLNISIEGLPFAAAIGAGLAFEWFWSASDGIRLKAYLGALTLVSALAFALTHSPASWTSHPHDALNDAHLAAFSVAWLCCLIVVRPQIPSRWARVGLMGIAGIIAGGAMFAVDRHCLQGPFQALDPLVRAYWYKGVDEGLPVWQLSFADAATGLAQPLVGLIGAIVAICRSQGEERHRWLTFAFLLGALTLSAVFVIREATTASVLSLPGTAYLCELALVRARKLSLMPVRVFATTAALFIMAPAYAAPALMMPANPQLVKAIGSTDSCLERSELEKLASLPPSYLATPLDITPAILASTPHRMIAGGYHRNASAIRDVILLFMGPPSQAREILARRHVDYVVFCPHTPQSVWWSNHSPQGLVTKLNANQAPDWLEPVDLHLHSLRVWRVRNEA